MGNFKEDVAKVKAFVFDVDGVLTDGGIIPTSDGDFVRKYNAKDGYAIGAALRSGYKIAIITGGIGKSLSRRFELLGVTRFYSNISDKLPVLKEFMKEQSLKPEEVLYMGDDIPDLQCMQYVGMPVAPANAVPEILEAARYVSQFGGGDACGRDVIEQVLRARGDWAKTTDGIHYVGYEEDK